MKREKDNQLAASLLEALEAERGFFSFLFKSLWRVFRSTRVKITVSTQRFKYKSTLSLDHLMCVCVCVGGKL